MGSIPSARTPRLLGIANGGYLTLNQVLERSIRFRGAY